MSEGYLGNLAGFRAGSLVAGYRLEAPVGEGGMAVVFRAKDVRLNRPVALKILAPGLASDPEFRQRFIAESLAAAAVDDPYIIPVYEAGEADGVLYIATRFVQGGDLRMVLDREGALPPTRATGFISPVASALDAAHAVGLIHRDVKPGNILVDARPGRPDHVYLSDFGISKAVAASVKLTLAGRFVGTVDYSAPEQIQGAAVDGRTDQYSLACVAYQLLTGVLPFVRDSPVAVMMAQVNELPPSLVSRQPGLPDAADQVLARAMAKKPEQRYASCGDFADALRDAFGLPPYDARNSAGAPTRPSAPPVPSSESPAPAAAADAPAAPALVSPAPADPVRLISVVPVPPPRSHPAAPFTGPGVDDHAAAAAPPEEAAAPEKIEAPEEIEVPEEEAAPEEAVPEEIVPGGSAPEASGTRADAPGITAELPETTAELPETTADALDATADSLGTTDTQDTAGTVTAPYAPSAAPDPVVESGPVVSSDTAVQSDSLVEATAAQVAGESRADVEESPAEALVPGPDSPPAANDEAGLLAPPVKPVSAEGSPAAAETASTDTWPGADMETAARPTEADRQAPAPDTAADAPDVPEADRRPRTETARIRRRRLPALVAAGVLLGAAGVISFILTSSANSPSPGKPVSSPSSSRPASLPTFSRAGIDIPPAFSGTNGLISALAFNPSGGTLAIADSNGICVWDIATSRCVSSFTTAYSVSFSPDGKLLAAVNAYGSRTSNQIIHLWDVAAKRQDTPIANPDSQGAFSVVFSPDGKTLATGDVNGRTYLWNVATRSPIGSPANPASKGVNSVTFSPDGKILAAGDANGRTYLWDVTGQKLIATPADPASKGVNSVTFSPDGKILAAGDANGSTYVWSVPAGRQIAKLIDPGSGGVNSVDFSLDGKILATGDEHGGVSLWHTGLRLVGWMLQCDTV